MANFMPKVWTPSLGCDPQTFANSEPSMLEQAGAAFFTRVGHVRLVGENGAFGLIANQQNPFLPHSSFRRIEALNPSNCQTVAPGGRKANDDQKG